MSETWADEDGALAFAKMLKGRRQAQVELLVGLAERSTDPNMTRCWAAIAQLDQVIESMEDERGKSDE